MAHIAFPMVLILTLSWTDQTFLIKSDQICPSCFYQCLIDKIVILRIPVLDQCALHCLLMRIDRDIDWLHISRINTCVIHTGWDRGRGWIKILHLLRHISQIPQKFCKLHCLLQGGTRVGGHQIWNQILLFTNLFIHIFIGFYKPVIDIHTRLAHFL